MKRVRRRSITVIASGAMLVSAMVALPSASALAATCNQSSHVWVATPAGTLANGNTLTLSTGTKVYPVGVVQPGSYIFFTSYEGNAPYDVDVYINPNAANGNCVVNQPSSSDAPLIGSGPGFWSVTANYVSWETGQTTTKLVGYVNIVP
jgi:hypothetical protein